MHISADGGLVGKTPYDYNTYPHRVPPSPHQHSSQHGPQHTASIAATPRYAQGRNQTPADAPTALQRDKRTDKVLLVDGVAKR